MLALKPAQIDFEPRSKTKGKGGSAKLFHVKRTVKEEERRVSDSIIYSALYSIIIIKRKNSKYEIDQFILFFLQRRIKELAAGNNLETREGKKKQEKQKPKNVLSRLI